MKKRIISLILVVATVFLTLTGCAYNYAKDDMTQYATMDFAAFYKYLQGEIKIADGDFGRDETVRQTKVEDAIAMAILQVTDTTDRKYEGKLAKYDSFYFCYYATDAIGNVFFADKMDESKAISLQLGLSTLSDFNKLISDNALSLDDIKDYLYSTSSAQVVGNGDIIAVSYTQSWDDNGQTATKEFYRTYETVNSNDTFLSALIGAKVGITLDGEFKKTVQDTEYTFTNVKVESILKDNSPAKVEEGDTVYVTYTISFDADAWYNSETKGWDLPFEYLGGKTNSEGKYELTYTNVVKVAGKADATDVTDDTRTFLGQLTGKEVGAAGVSFTAKETIKGQTVDVKYSGVKVNWIVEKGDVNNGFTFTYKPHDEKLKDDNSNKKTEKNTKGEDVILNNKDGGVELTYHIFPVYYLDVEDVNAELIVREFYSALASTETKEHDHTEENHEHEEEFVFSTLNDNEYKNGDKTLATLVEELVELYTTLSEKEKTLETELKDLTSAQESLAKYTGSSQSEKDSLISAKDKAQDDYTNAKKAVNLAQKNVDEKIEAVLACKKGETGVAEALVADYRDYQYDTLEAAYEEEITENLAAKIIAYLNDTTKVVFTGNLPKKAVKNAYKAIMNTYKYDFYEGKYSSGTSSSSTTTETNYHYYKGNFEDYLIDKVTSNKGDMDDVKASIQSTAEETVKEIIIVYLFANAVEAKWNDADVILTKDEKKTIKENLEQTAILYQQYGLSFTYNVDDSYHAGQFDKVMNFLLETKESENENDLKVYFANIKYDFETTETE